MTVNTDNGVVGDGVYEGKILNNGNTPGMKEALIQNVVGLGNHLQGHVANVFHSGQNGTGIRITKLDGATPLVFNPVIPVVLTVPTMWNKFPQKQEMLRALMETHARNISGIDFSYALEATQIQLGHDGQQMDVPTRTTRSQVSPSATFTEYTGNIIYKFFSDWMFDIQHPDTNASALPAMGVMDEDMPGWTMSAYSMSMLFIQPDPTGLPDRIVDAFVVVNMFPKDMGEIGFQRQLGTSETKERSINFTGIVQHNNNTKELGIRTMQMLGLHRINYNNALPGLIGTVDPAKAIQTELQGMSGGIHWEANAGTTRENVKAVGSMGSANNYRPLNAEMVSTQNAINIGNTAAVNVQPANTNAENTGSLM